MATDLKSKSLTRAKPTSVAALFGDDSDSQPLWFKKDAFVEPEFDSDNYISELKKFVPLDTLRTELKSHLTSLKSELVELINRDYADFVNLSTKLVDVDGAVLRMRMPLSDLRSKLVAVRDSLAASLQNLKEGLKKRGETSNARQLLELLLDTSHVLSKVEKLLLELEHMPLESEEGTWDSKSGAKVSRPADWDDEEGQGGVGLRLEESRSRLLERIASEMNRLKFYVARAHDLPFIQNMEKRINSAELSLSSHLRHCLRSGLERKDQPVLFHCLRAYAALDDTAGAELAFRETVVAPTVSSSLQVNSSAPSQLIRVVVDDRLPAVYAELEKGIKRDCQFLLDLAFVSNSGLHSFEFLSNSILREVHGGIQRVIPGAFSPGKPEEFLSNYNASLAFLTFLEGFCPTQSAVTSFRLHPAYVDFLKQWNLGVYFNLRFREIAEALDTVLMSPSLVKASTNASGGLGFSLEGARVLWDSLDRCWHPEIYISSISDKFLKLTLQLINRYTTWLRAGVSSRKAAISQAGNRDAAISQPGGGAWGVSASAEDFVLVLHDVDLLGKSVGGTEFISKVGTALGSCIPPNVREKVKASLSMAANGLQEQKRALLDVLTEIIAEKCYEVLRQLKGITATYRMTNKPMPTRHSHYVNGILHPLKAFVDDGRGGMSRLSQEVSAEIVSLVVERVTSRFDEMARELVTMARKTESSLIRLRRDRRSATSDAGTAQFSDTDKITTQLFLDVQEYGNQISNFGVKAKTVSQYVSLWQCVAPPDRQQVG